MKRVTKTLENMKMWKRLKIHDSFLIFSLLESLRDSHDGKDFEDSTPVETPKTNRVLTMHPRDGRRETVREAHSEYAYS